MKTATKTFFYSLAFSLLLPHGLLSQSTHKNPAHGLKPPAVIRFNSHVGTWIKGYSKWSTAHPELLFPQDAKQSQGSQSKDQVDDSALQINLRWPFLSYFAPDGTLLYVSMDSDANVKFVQELPKSAMSQSGTKVFPPQPPLATYFEIFKPLQSYKAGLSAQKQAVLLTICQDIAPACKQQNEAVEALKKRLPSLHLQLVEVMVVPDKMLVPGNDE